MYKCSCYSEDRYVCGLVRFDSAGGAKRINITYCEHCDKHYFNVSYSLDKDSKIENCVNRIELTEDEATELIEKIKCCKEPRDNECRCPIHKFIDSFESKNVSRATITCEVAKYLE